MTHSPSQYLDGPGSSPIVMAIGDGSAATLESLAESLGFQVICAMGPKSVLAMDSARLAAVIILDGQYVQSIAESLRERSRVPLLVVLTADVEALSLYQSGATDVLPNLDPRCLFPKLALYLDLFRRAQGLTRASNLDPGRRSAESETAHLLVTEQYTRQQLGAGLGSSDETKQTVMLAAAAPDLRAQKNLEEEYAALLHSEQRARRAAEDANRAKDEFLATMSHELRTPLNAILGWTRMLHSGVLSDDQKNRALEVIERNTKAQVKLIDDLLDVSRIISGKLQLTTGPVDLMQVVEEALDTVRPAANAKAIRIAVQADAEVGPMTGDPSRLQQVVANLLNNAVKFTPKGGQIHVRLQRQDSAIEIVVSDTGVGIDASFLPSVFDRFKQADGTITRSQGGLGLGLAIVKHLVELHGGTIIAESEGIGKGAQFTVRIPTAPLKLAPAVDTTSGETKDAGRFENLSDIAGLRILVVEDEVDARELLRSVLEHCGATVIACGSAREALTALTVPLPDIILSDIGMPEEDGYSFIRKVRALAPERGGRIPAIALTAYARSEDRTKALKAGFTHHIAKPIEPSELLATISAVIGRFTEK